MRRHDADVCVQICCAAANFAVQSIGAIVRLVRSVHAGPQAHNDRRHDHAVSDLRNPARPDGARSRSSPAPRPSSTTTRCRRSPTSRWPSACRPASTSCTGWPRNTRSRPFDITTATVGGVEVAVQEQVAIDKPFCRLLRFKRFTDNAEALARMKTQPTVLVVAPLSGHHSTLLRDTVKALLHDHKVFITDWTDARMVPAEAGPFHLDDYVEYVQEFIRHIGPEVHVISVCQPTVPVLAAVSLMASRGEATPRTMTMMGGPIDARKQPDQRQQPGHQQEPQLVREQRHLARAAQLPRRRPARLPRLPAAHRLRGDEPRPPRLQPLRLLPRPDPRRRRQRRGAPPVLRRVQRRARHAGRVLPGHHQDRVPGLRAGQRHLGRARRTGAAAGHHDHRAADHRRRARRHLRRRPDARRARSVRQASPRAAQFHYDAQGRRPLRHLLRPPLAREGLPRGARLHRPLRRRDDGPAHAAATAKKARAR